MVIGDCEMNSDNMIFVMHHTIENQPGRPAFGMLTPNLLVALYVPQM